jgi:proline iminopeptidase
MRTLYPEIEPYTVGNLPVSEIHSLYYEECGNPAGKPAVFLHGGPGGGFGPDARRFFDPQAYHIVLFDQRGAGRSTPYADLRENTTWTLVEDMEKLRVHLGIERWVVFGGSWGSTLALCYAIAHPERVVALVLRGVYLGRRWENEWLFQKGASYFYPDKFADYIAPIPPEERGDLIGAYHKRLTDSDEAVHLPAAKTWSAWEGCQVRMFPVVKTGEDDPRKSLAIARFECDYIFNDMFFPNDNYILDNVAKITHIPCRMVHGRHDTICPPTNAWELSNAWPQAGLVFVTDGAHNAAEPGMASELVQALDDFSKL